MLCRNSGSSMWPMRISLPLCWIGGFASSRLILSSTLPSEPIRGPDASGYLYLARIAACALRRSPSLWSNPDAPVRSLAKHAGMTLLPQPTQATTRDRSKLRLVKLVTAQADSSRNNVPAFNGSPRKYSVKSYRWKQVRASDLYCSTTWSPSFRPLEELGLGAVGDADIDCDLLLAVFARLDREFRRKPSCPCRK